MDAVKLNGRVTEEGELVLDRLISLSPGPVEVILLREAAVPAGASRSGETLLRALADSGLVGAWSDRTDISDSIEFTHRLRAQLERDDSTPSQVPATEPSRRTGDEAQG